MMPQALTRAALQRTGCAGVLLLLGWPAFAQVGIGTNEPTARLHIVGRAVENGQDLRVENLDPAPVPADARVVVSDSEGYFYTATIEQLVDIDDEEDDDKEEEEGEEEEEEDEEEDEVEDDEEEEEAEEEHEDEVEEEAAESKRLSSMASK